MDEGVRKPADDFEKVMQAALEDDNIPTFYFNGFINSIGTGDVLIILRRHDKSIAKLHASYTVAKTLAEKLGALIARLEADTGNTIMTTDVVNEALSRAKDGDDGTA